MKINKTWVIIALGIVIAILLYRGCNSSYQNEEQIALYETAQDSLKTAKNKLGQQEATMGMFVADRRRDLAKLESNDKTIQRLQKSVKSYKGKLRTATALNTATNSIGTVATIIRPIDTTYSNGTPIVYPIYESSWDRKWSSGSIIADKDSINWDIRFRNEYDITQGWEKQGFLKPKKPTVNIRSLNPMTETEDVRSFTVQPKNKRLNVGVGITYGLIIPSFQTGTVLGVTANYTIFKF